MKTSSTTNNSVVSFIDKIPYFKRIVIGIFLVIGFALYSNSVSNPFIWDDFDLIVYNPSIKGWGQFFYLFQGNVVEQSSFYRPLQSLSYMLDFLIWGLNPKGFHITSIVLHVGVASSLFWMSLELFKNRILAVLAGLLFLVHPIHNEAVVYISGRADLLVAIFILLSLTFYFRFDSGNKKMDMGFSIFCFIMAILSKEYALILPLFLVVYHFSIQKKYNAKLFCSISVIGFVYLLLRAFNIVGVADMHTKTQTILLQRLPGTFYAMFEYIRLLVLPYNLYLGYGQKMFYWSNIYVWLGLFLTFTLIGLIFQYKKSNRLIGFALGWYLVGLIPVMNIYPINAYMAEHWLYIPSMGFFILVAWGMSRCLESKKVRDVMTVAGIFILVVLSLLTVRQNTYWSDPVTFYQRIIDINPKFVKAYNNLGKHYSNQGEYAKAAEYFKMSFEVEPRFEKGYHNYAVCMAKMFHYDVAIEYYNKVLSINPNFAPTYNNLGALYIDQKNFDVAEQYVNKALSIKPNIPKAYYNLGLIEQGRGDEVRAVEYFKMALKYDSNYDAARNNLGSILSKKGKFDRAMDYYAQILANDPKNETVLNNMGILFGQKGDVVRSIEYFSRALQVKPDYADAHFNIGFAFAKKRSFGQAVRHYQDAIKYDPTHLKAINNLAIILANQNRLSEAEQLFVDALELNESDVSTHNNLGLILARQKKFDKAISHYQFVLEANPKHKEAHNNLAMLYDETGKIKKAEQHYIEALKLDPTFTNALNGLGIVYGKAKKYKEAEQLFLRALKINPNGKDAIKNLQRARLFIKKEGI